MLMIDAGDDDADDDRDCRVVLAMPKCAVSKRYKPWFQAIPRPIIIISWIITANYRKIKTISYIIWIIPIILDYLANLIVFLPASIGSIIPREEIPPKAPVCGEIVEAMTPGEIYVRQFFFLHIKYIIYWLVVYLPL